MSAADEILNDICQYADESLAFSPQAAFAVVIWVKGKAGEAGAVALGHHPDSRNEVLTALRTAVSAVDGEPA